ncbi:BRO family protein [Streptococcus suis]|uniref:BRO family protein n=1 Tax=Streptococcus suis TaxID=1307 RepID=UPI00209AD50F|nr:BRO family protein [Streptococcus suis]MCO8240675.1 BRO family protein [Streptococcus suis]
MRRNYSKVIDELRSDHGLNLVAIGQRIGTDPRTVGKWWQGKNIPNQNSRQKLNKLYREVKQNMTTQVSIFEDETTGQIMQVVTTTTFHGQPLNIYGSEQEPYFMARDIAEMIDYQKTAQGKYNTAKMLTMVDEDEKIKGIPNSHTLINNGTTVWFLTEQGLYEVLFQSRKPKAKEFKKVVKNILKEIRTQGYYMQGELIQDQPTTQPLPGISDLTYIKNKIAEVQEMDNLADITAGLERVAKLVSVIGG